MKGQGWISLLEILHRHEILGVYWHMLAQTHPLVWTRGCAKHGMDETAVVHD